MNMPDSLNRHWLPERDYCSNRFIKRRYSGGLQEVPGYIIQLTGSNEDARKNADWFTALTNSWPLPQDEYRIARRAGKLS
jgi:hypothetical protein